MLTVFKMMGKKVPSATATIKRHMYDTKNTYVLGREKTFKKALVSQVTSVYLVAPLPKRLIAIWRSRSLSAGVFSGNVRSRK